MKILGRTNTQPFHQITAIPRDSGLTAIGCLAGATQHLTLLGC